MKVNKYIGLFLLTTTLNANLANYQINASSKNKPIVVIAHEVEGQALATMVVNSARQTLKCLALKAPGFGNERSEILKDIYHLLKYHPTKGGYIDWAITTPIMLINTIVFMKYINTLNSKEIITFTKFLHDNLITCILIIVCNAFMLLFGYLGETQAIHKRLSISIGFLFFFIVFYLI